MLQRKIFQTLTPLRNFTLWKGYLIKILIQIREQLHTISCSGTHIYIRILHSYIRV